MTWSDLASSMNFGQVVSYDGWKYRFSAADLMWGTRYVIGEKESHADSEEAYLLLWTMTNRMYQTWPRYPTLAKMVLAYSSALRDPDASPAPSAEVAARRRRIRSLDPRDVPGGVLARVVRFMEGKVAPGRAVGFVHQDECGAGEVHPMLGTPAYRSPSGECYWKAGGSESWTAETLTALTGSGSSTSALPVFGGLAVLVGLVVWAARMR